MSVFTIINVAIPLPLSQLFDYLLPNDCATKASSLQKGMRVQVPFRRKQVVGFIISISNKTDVPLNRLKPITAILDETPLLPSVVIKFIEWVSQYYHHALGEVMEMAFPAQLRKIKSIKQRPLKLSNNAMSNNEVLYNNDIPTLNDEQQRALDKIQASFKQFGVFLLAGVTGSGKTEVYLRLIQKVVEEGKQILLLVPEISLTPQMVARLQQRLGKEKIVLSHSRLTDLQRFKSWESMKSGEKLVMVGTRSAIFTPFKQLGLIIIDEEHDGSFKQQGSVGYHARDVAVVRASLEKVPIVLGSATPSLESVYNATTGRYCQLNLSQRAGSAFLPQTKVIDLRKQRLQSGLSNELLRLMHQHLEAKGQVLLFLNRRGFAPIYLCHGCGWVMTCSACDSPFRLHTRPSRLICHYCERIRAIPSSCPNCHQNQLFALGEGTQRLESFLINYFPNVISIRIDADSTRGKDKMATLLTRIHSGEPAVLIGTQLLAKGHHFPNVTLAAIVNGDAGLFNADFRSLEQAAQLTVQVGGRAGRASREGQIVVQTHHPNHPLLNQLIKKGYTAFSQIALKEREQSNWPPFSYLALLKVDSLNKKLGLDFLTQIKNGCLVNSLVSVLGPVPALAAKRAGYYRAQLLFRSKNRKALHSVLRYLERQLQLIPKREVRCYLDIDPAEIC